MRSSYHQWRSSELRAARQRCAGGVPLATVAAEIGVSPRALLEALDRRFGASWRRRKQRRRWTKPEVRAALERLRLGETPAGLAADLGVTEKALRSVIARVCGSSSWSEARKSAMATRDEQIAAALLAGAEPATLAERVGVTESIVLRVRREQLGLSRRAPMPRELEDALLEARRAGATLGALGRQHGYRPVQILRAVRRAALRQQALEVA